MGTPPLVIDPDAPTLQWRDWLFACALVAAIFLAYQPAWHGQQIWDDDAHITIPALRSAHGLFRIWFVLDATQQYYPLVHSSFWVEYKLWGESVLQYHMVNLAMHAAVVLLFWRLLVRLRVPGAAFAAAIFALHPIEVESVAWISELKNTLSGVLCLAAVICYLEFDEKRSVKWYVLALGLFIAGLFAKSVIAMAAPALLVILWWKRGRIDFMRDLLPLLPLLIIGAAMGIFTAWVEHRYIGAGGRPFAFTPIERCLIAGRALCFYPGKLLWPVKILFIYPRWQIHQQSAWEYAYPAGVLLLGGFLWLLRGRSRGPLAAVLIYALMLFPAIGFLNVYPFVFSFVADHFQYLASLSLIALFAAAAATLLRHFGEEIRIIGAGIAVMIVGGLAFLTWRQTHIYRGKETLYTATIAGNPGCWMAYNNRGNLYNTLGDSERAIADFRECIALNPTIPDAHLGLGTALGHVGKTWDSIREYDRVIELDPKNALAYNDRGNTYNGMGRPEEAIADYTRAIELQPDYPMPLNGRAAAYSLLGRNREALADYARALELKPDYTKVYVNRGLLFLHAGDFERAAADFTKALQFDPSLLDAHLSLGAAYDHLGKVPNAIAEYTRAIDLDPGSFIAYNERGNAYRNTGRAKEAIDDYTRAIKLQPESPIPFNGRGAAHAILGQTDAALLDYARALQLKPDYGFVYANRAGLYCSMKEYDKAWADVRAARALGVEPAASVIKELTNATNPSR